jgi:hypothetical protein
VAIEDAVEHRGQPDADATINADARRLIAVRREIV